MRRLIHQSDLPVREAWGSQGRRSLVLSNMEFAVKDKKLEPCMVALSGSCSLSLQTMYHMKNDDQISCLLTLSFSVSPLFAVPLSI